MNESSELVKRITQAYHPSALENGGPLSRQADYDVEADEKSEIGMRGYLHMIRRQLWLIIILTLLCTALTAVYVAGKPDIYGAEARIQIDLESNPALNVNGKPLVVNNPASAPDYFETQLEILRSPSLLRRVVKTLDLEHNRAFLHPQTGQRTKWQRLREMIGLNSGYQGNEPLGKDHDILLTTSLAPPTSRENLDEIRRLSPYVAVIENGLDIEQVGHTRLVEIREVHRDPQVAAKIVNAIADTFAQSNLERMTETNTGAGTFLQKRIAELQEHIRKGEEQLINYAKNNQIISLDESQNTVVDRLAGLNRQLMEAENERKLAEAAYRAAQEPGAADALAATNSTQSDLSGKLGDLRQRLAQLRAEYTDEWPEVQVLRKQIDELEKQAAEARTLTTGLVLKNLETKFHESQDRERAVRSAFQQQRGLTVTQNAAAINYRIIQQEIQTNRELLNGLLQRFKENDVILAGTPNNVRVVDYANTPSSAIGPQRVRGVMLAFAFSLVVGIGLALLRELSDNTVRTTEDVERKIHLPAIAVVPSVKGWSARRLLPSSRILRLGGRGDQTRPLLTHVDVRSALAEVYRKLRTTVLHATDGKPPGTILVTSSLPAEGKTTTAVNMAMVLAQAGARTLLIDADMRQPTLHEIFDLDNNQGLSTALASDFSETEILSMVQCQEESGLHVITSGPQPLNPSELLSSSEMHRLLAVLGQSFTHILIDSPPVISCTDSVLIARIVDGVLLVVQGGKSAHEIVQHSRRELQGVGAHVFGVVLNNVEETPQDQYYYYARPA